MKSALPNPDDDQLLLSRLLSPKLANDWLALVMFLYPWGKPGTPLEKFKSPHKWQCEELDAISAHIEDNNRRIARGETPEMYRSVTCSGHGIGKGALTNWIEWIMMSTRLGSSTISAANKEEQLRTRTWAEAGKWAALAINRHFFDCGSMSIKPAAWFASQVRDQLGIGTDYYYAQGQLWSEENPDAFAGVHNQNGVCVVLDEASGIPKPIWTIIDGFFTDPTTNRFFFAWSNGRRNTGQFFECFHKDRGLYRTHNIDSRDVEGTDKLYLNGLVQKYGEDSDEVRVMVRGLFPRLGEDQFIARELVESAVTRPLLADKFSPAILGVDPARHGTDKTVLRWRIGRDARSIKPVVLSGYDTIQVGQAIEDEVARFRRMSNFRQEAIWICIDAGQGTGIFDYLMHRQYPNLELVWFSGKSDDPQWYDRRTFIWAKMRDWLAGGCIDNNQVLIDDLVGPCIKRWEDSDKQKLESKDSMKKRGLASPDHGDALAVTFAINPLPVDMTRFRDPAPRIAHGTDYDIYGRYNS